MNLKESKRKRKLADLIFIWGMLAVPIIWFCVFWIYVNINSILMAFKSYLGAGEYEWGFQNFKDIFHEFSLSDSVLSEALKNTLLFFPLNLFIIGMSLCFSYLFYRKVPGTTFFRIMFYLPSVIPSVVMISLFEHVIGPYGPISLLLKNVFGFTTETIPYWLSDDRFAMPTIMIHTLWTAFGMNVILFGNAMSRAPQQVIEAGRIDGVNGFREFFSIMIPLIWPMLSTSLIFLFSGLFMASGGTLLLTGGAYGTMNLSVFIFNNVSGGAYEYPSAVGLLFTMIGFPIVLGARYIFTRIYSEVDY